MSISTVDFVEGSSGIVEGDVSSNIPTPHPLTLNFRDEILEQKFRSYYLVKRLPLLRFTLPLLLLVVALLGLSYDLVFVDSPTITFWNRVLRYGIGIPSIAIFYLSTCFPSFYRNHVQLLNVVFALTLGGVNVSTAIIGQQPDHGPQMLYFCVVYNFLQLRFLYASGVCWTLFTAFILSARYATQDNKLGLSAGYMTVCNLALMFACWFTEYWIRLDFSRHFILRMEEQRTNDLLSTLLPERITLKLREMKLSDNLIAEEFQNVSILFSDIVGFTAYCASLTSREIINFLNVIYTTFDHLTVIHEVLKVETIGDAYFVASGVLEQRADHADLLANMAFDMGHILTQFKFKDGFKLQVRIGMHCGRVIAGVVGLKVPRYHLFGDCVTIASLMESTGVPSKIQVSEPFYNQLKDKSAYVFEPRLDPDTEGKRKNMKTYFLTSGEVENPFIDGNATSNPDPQRPINQLRPLTQAEINENAGKFRKDPNNNNGGEFEDELDLYEEREMDRDINRTIQQQHENQQNQQIQNEQQNNSEKDFQEEGKNENLISTNSHDGSIARKNRKLKTVASKQANVKIHTNNDNLNNLNNLNNQDKNQI